MAPIQYSRRAPGSAPSESGPVALRRARHPRPVGRAPATEYVPESSLNKSFGSPGEDLFGSHRVEECLDALDQRRNPVVEPVGGQRALELAPDRLIEPNLT